MNSDITNIYQKKQFIIFKYFTISSLEEPSLKPSSRKAMAADDRRKYSPIFDLPTYK